MNNCLSASGKPFGHRFGNGLSVMYPRQAIALVVVAFMAITLFGNAAQAHDDSTSTKSTHSHKSKSVKSVSIRFRPTKTPKPPKVAKIQNSHIQVKPGKTITSRLSPPPAQPSAPPPRPAATVNLNSYGLVADGTTDNINAFNNAIFAAGNGGTVMIPAGHIAYSQVIVANNVNLIGAGVTSTILIPIDPTNSAIQLTTQRKRLDSQ